jgi:hypothetical protein
MLISRQACLSEIEGTVKKFNSAICAFFAVKFSYLFHCAVAANQWVFVVFINGKIRESGVTLWLSV